MKLIDKRAIPLNVTFGDLPIGDAFQDEEGDINIKMDIGASIYWAEDHWVTSYTHDEEELIIPLEITYVVERKNKQ